MKALRVKKKQKKRNNCGENEEEMMRRMCEFSNEPLWERQLPVLPNHMPDSLQILDEIMMGVSSSTRSSRGVV